MQPHSRPGELAKLRRLDAKKLPQVKGRPRLGSCVATPPKFVAIGLNYVDHAKESGNPIPAHPVVFFKAETCIGGANDPIMLPPDSTHTDWEVELGVVIGKIARHVDKKDAFKHVAGYCIVNDVSEREYQMQRSATQWGKGKGCDTFGPVGPWLVTTDEIKDPQNLDMWLAVNGIRKQTGNTRTMIFGVADLVADVSKYMTLLPGDIITTGHPTWRRHGDEARAAVPQARRRRDAGHRRPGRAATERDCLQAETLGAACRPMPPRTQYARSAGVHIAYPVLGSGLLDLVYVPGWVSPVEQAWEEPSLARFIRRGSGPTAHRRGRTRQRSGWRNSGQHRCPDRGERSARPNPRLQHGQGPHRRVRYKLHRARSARVQGCARAMEPVQRGMSGARRSR